MDEKVELKKKKKILTIWFIARIMKLRNSCRWEKGDVQRKGGGDVDISSKKGQICSLVGGV